jgi:transposase InsO family protein
MCTFLEVSRAGYYAWLKRSNNPDQDLERKGLVKEAYQASHRTYGYRRIQMWIKQKYSLQINHKAVLRLMNKLGVHSIARRRKFLKKADDLATHHHYPNILNREFSADRPNQKWVTDVTFVHTKQGWAYLSTIKDLHDGFIVAHNFVRQNSLGLVINTLKSARQKEVVTDGLILHSDQGYQYTSQSYFALTKEYNITPSMSRRANCWDNAPMENFFGHLKEEALRQVLNPSFDEAKEMINAYIYFYNYERIQLKTRQTPYQFRCLSF